MWLRRSSALVSIRQGPTPAFTIKVRITANTATGLWKQMGCLGRQFVAAEATACSHFSLTVDLEDNVPSATEAACGWTRSTSVFQRPSVDLWCSLTITLSRAASVAGSMRTCMPLYMDTVHLGMHTYIHMYMIISGKNMCMYTHTYINICVCMCICMYVCMYVCMHACMHVFRASWHGPAWSSDQLR